MATDQDSLQLCTTATMANLSGLLALADRACDAANLDDDSRHAVRLLAEEVCANVISHGYAASQPGPIELSLRWAPERMTIQVSDRAAVFSPDDAPAPDLDSDWQHRALGGLGLHLVRSLADEFEHACLPGGGNRYTMVKHTRKTPTQEST